MTGIDAATGRPLSGLQHLAQSVRDILTTRIGTRVGRRDYGSIVPDLVDQPFNAVTRVRLIAATAVAIARWEPRIRLTQVRIAATEIPGRFTVDLTGRTTMPGRATDLASLSVQIGRPAA